LYEVDVVIEGVRYRYGFQLSAARVEEEWLFAWPQGRKAMWFEREGDHFEFGKSLHGENEAIRSLTRPNSLFLSAAAQNNHAALLPIVRHVSAWRFALTRRGALLGSGLSRSQFVTELQDQGLIADPEPILRLLREADTGILDIRVEEAGVATSAARLSALAIVRPSGMFFRHRTEEKGEAWLPLALESAGTVSLLELAPSIIDTLRHGGLLCIDELEASLHPALALTVVKMFNDPSRNPRNAQLIFTTHDTHLLGSIVGEPALRRDQIWFTEKDDGGGTHLYPLTDFHPRKEENLERGYLQGRYGAVPFVGELVGKFDGGEDS